MGSELPSVERISSSTKAIAVERSLRIKTIYLVTEEGLEFSSEEVLHLSPVVERPCEPNEDPMPLSPVKWDEARDVGYWRRLTDAIKRFGWRDRIVEDIYD